MTALTDLYDNYGQSPWIDNLRRDWLSDGTLAKYLANGVRGMTSNPSIFAKTIGGSAAYDDDIANSKETDPEKVFESLAVADVQNACDLLAVVHESSKREFASGTRRYLDGFVSLEVSPRLAHDTEGTVAAAKRLFAEVSRPNVMIKIPATKAGLPAITAVLGAGINVNVTLIFSVERYNEVISAWRQGISEAHAAGLDITNIASVASFFVSRVDVAVDALLPEGDARRGRTANAQAAAAYQLYRTRAASDEVTNLLSLGAQVQRPLWASTSTKNPSYDKLLYVDRLVADETVNTMPDATLADALEHLNPATSYLLTKESCHQTADELNHLEPDVTLAKVSEQLEEEGVASFAKSYDELLATVSSKMHSVK
ncbi:MAG TPA: transaldolase [Acidimicrobiales bacterium]|jgi:transaldolase|nr:transaldolase [Acidimicrobiales bacterium]